MKNSAKHGVLLKGGLGNQLFQISAGLFASGGKPLEIFNNFTAPRETNGVADALYFSWPENVYVNELSSNKLERKLLALNLSAALRLEKSTGSKVWSQLVRIATDFLFTVKFRTPTNVFSGKGVGFCAINLKPQRCLLNGYFQAHQFPSHPSVISILRDIRLQKTSVSLGRWIEKAKLEKPIIVHLRLGDYKNESGIGILPPRYFEKALKLIESKESSKNIWIFTNEVESVSAYIVPPSSYSVSIIGEAALNPAETLELMRYGSAYVVANSTFSWWAAFLSHQSGCTTIMPKPWFQNLPSPLGIKPQDWIEIEIPKH